MQKKRSKAKAKPAHKPKAKRKSKKQSEADRLQRSLLEQELASRSLESSVDEPEKVGRPTLYTDELAARICIEISTCSDGLEKICERNPDFPSARTVYRWLIDHKPFCQNYVRAKKDQSWALAEQIIPIADTPQIGEIVTVKTDGVEIKRVDMIEHRKLQIDARKWILAHLEPKKWGTSPDSDDDDSRLDELIDAINASRKKKGE